MFSRFFLHRPIFATVVSLFLVIAGLLAIPQLAVEQTPNITPPTVSVKARYPGASPETIARTVAQVIEDQVNGVEDMLYLSSSSGSDGSYELTVSFEVGTDVDQAAVLVQNRVAIAEPKLPAEVVRQGVTVEKKSTSIVLIAMLVSPQRTYDTLFLGNYLSTRVKETLRRVPGVGSVTIFGARDFGMRLWLDPERLRARGLTTEDVLTAVREQNVQVAAGTIGGPPAPAGTQIAYTVQTAGRASSAAEFERLIVKVGERGELVRLSEVARVELGAQDYGSATTLNGMDAVALAVYQLPGANALAVASGIRERLAELERSFPPDLEARIPFDTTQFVEASIAEVLETLWIALLLVVATVYLFLQDWRASLIPTATIPVSLIGTFAVMLGLGMSINTLTLFGLVLAIGIVVDDAIVVVESVSRVMAEEKVDAKTATEKTMQVITGPVIATTLVLLAVFVPATLMPGITGRLYQQFALTISVATCISSLNALTFAPALCGLLLRPAPARRGLFFRGFDAALEGTRAVYLFGVRALCRRLLIGAPLFLALLAATAFGFAKLPTGFLPDEDQGYCLAHLQLPEGATLERTIAVAERLERELSQIPGIAFVTRIAGFNLLDSVGSQSCGIYFIAFDPWSERPQPERHAQALVAQMNRRWSQEPAALAFGFLPPPIAGLGNATGFDLRLLDLGGFGPERQLGQAVELLRAAQQDGRVTRLNLNLRLDAPQVYVDLDREKAKRLGVPLQVVFDTLQAALGSAYVNDFDVFGKSFRVLVQADARFRDELEDIRKLEVRSAAGAMVPLGTLVRLEERAGPPTLTRFDNSASVTITGQPAPGISSGEALRAMEELAVRVLPSGATTAWSGVSYQQKAAGDTAPLVFALALLFAFLFLAAQYESWSAPLAVLLNAPIALLGGLALTAALRLDNNIYTQIGFVLLIGLASKNAILIVELAKERVAAGASVLDAAIEAARERYRAILMTALSFLLGVLPLLFASGAGAASRRALGAAVLGGMGLATTLGIFLIPMLYVLVGKIARVRPAVREDSNAPGGSPDAA